ncbi:MAG TPA: thiol:disulfide interchange protein DsbA/DsbL [Thermoanaerobaculia bacterium]|nr:thiol:disulfide interchange protein DsbA/DsbL [Thermoanaerobaculia bacterium]
MKKIGSMLMALLVCASALPAHAAPAPWVEGTHYDVLERPQATTVPAGKVEVMEVFSYACPYCDKFQPIMHKLQRSLPRNAQIVFLPASFIPTEDWPMFQRAYFAAQSLGIAARTHEAIYDAVWKTGELAIEDQSTNRLKNPLPSIEDAARCYSRLTGVSQQAFLTAARSFGVETQMREADEQIEAMQVPGTPCIVVAGKYRINMQSLSKLDDVIPLVKFLVAKASSHS